MNETEHFLDGVDSNGNVYVACVVKIPIRHERHVSEDILEPTTPDSHASISPGDVRRGRLERNEELRGPSPPSSYD
jgi:hypothetical protein